MILTFAGHCGHSVNRRGNTGKQWNGFWHEWKTEATSGITKSCDGFWDILYDCRRWLTLCCFWSSYQNIRPVAFLYTHCVPALMVAFIRCADVAGFLCSQWQRGSLLCSLCSCHCCWHQFFCETVPLTSLVHEITALKFKLQVAVYLNHNYPQHFHYKTLDLVLWNLPFGWRNLLHTKGVFVC